MHSSAWAKPIVNSATLIEPWMELIRRGAADVGGAAEPAWSRLRLSRWLAARGRLVELMTSAMEPLTSAREPVLGQLEQYGS